MSGDAPTFIAALDIGSTNLKCDIVDNQGNVVGSSTRKIALVCPQPGWIEINPDELFKDVLEVINKSIYVANINILNVKSLGISTNRGTFVTWKKDTGECLHNFISWQDLRCEQLLNELHSSISFKLLQWILYGFYLLTRLEKLKLASHIRINTRQVTGRLLWVINNIPSVKQNLLNKNLMFGTINTWLVYKLTKGEKFLTDISNACPTGLYDPFAQTWSVFLKYFKIPDEILPPVVANDFDFGHVADEFFGVPLKIGCILADQSASMYGSCCFDKNDIKLTMGTGAFIDVNTDREIWVDLNEMYPLICWKLEGKAVYVSEMPCLETGYLFEQLQKDGVIRSPNETSDVAFKAKPLEGLYFMTNLSQTKLSYKFVGLGEDTHFEQKVRAILEGVVFDLITSFNVLKSKRNQPFIEIKVDGGVSQNNFICQTLSDLTNLPISRQITNASTLGVAFLTGVLNGTWKSQKQIKSLQKVDRVFRPCDNLEYKQKLMERYYKWTHIKSWTI